MDRILIGRAEANDEPSYIRSGRTGIFISKPGANVSSCPDGHLTFDSTSAGLLQMISEGDAIIPASTDGETAGSLTITTGELGSRGDRPVQVWWTNKSKGFANSITNLSFIEVGKNNSITTENYLKNISGYLLNCTTFIDSDGMVAIKFDNASQQDNQYIHYNVFRQGGYAEPEEYDLQLNLTVRAYNEGVGGNLNGQPTGDHRHADGRYYTVIFPDDFVYRKNKTYPGFNSWGNDPFYQYRDVATVDKGKIDARCHITLTIPEDVDISGNDFDNYLKLSGGLYGDVNSYATYGPTSGVYSDKIGRNAHEREALNDPCILLNMNSEEWTDRALSGTKIIIENSGDIIGAGGFGAFGTLSSDEGKLGSGLAGGGGGGGAGHHMSFSQATAAYPYEVYMWNANPTLASSENSRKPGFGGQGHAGGKGFGGVHGPVDPEFFGQTGSYGQAESGGAGGSANEKSTSGIQNDAGWNPGRTGDRGSWDFWRWKGDAFADPDYIFSYVTPYIYYGQERSITFNDISGHTGRPIVFSPYIQGTEPLLDFMGVKSNPATSLQYVPDYGLDTGEHGGYIYAGHGGSCVYLFANTPSTISGLKVEIINKQGGRIMGGGGGGAGGHMISGSDGGDLGSPGSPGTEISTNDSRFQWGRYGEPGRIMWWNSTNVTSNYTIINQSSTSGTIKGLDGDYYFES